MNYKYYVTVLLEGSTQILGEDNKAVSIKLNDMERIRSLHVTTKFKIESDENINTVKSDLFNLLQGKEPVKNSAGLMEIFTLEKLDILSFSLMKKFKEETEDVKGV